MFVNTEQVQLGVSNYVENEICKKAVGVNKFITYMAMPIINKKIAHYINDLSSNELISELFDENKNIELDTIYNMAKNAIKKSGQFVMYGIVFNETDIDKLYNYIRGTI
jgi:hypothetical protein